MRRVERHNWKATAGVAEAAQYENYSNGEVSSSGSSSNSESGSSSWSGSRIDATTLQSNNIWSANSNSHFQSNSKSGSNLNGQWTTNTATVTSHLFTVNTNTKGSHKTTSATATDSHFSIATPTDSVITTAVAHTSRARLADSQSPTYTNSASVGTWSAKGSPSDVSVSAAFIANTDTPSLTLTTTSVANSGIATAASGTLSTTNVPASRTSAAAIAVPASLASLVLFSALFLWLRRRLIQKPSADPESHPRVESATAPKNNDVVTMAEVRPHLPPTTSNGNHARPTDWQSILALESAAQAKLANETKSYVASVHSESSKRHADLGFDSRSQGDGERTRNLSIPVVTYTGHASHEKDWGTRRGWGESMLCVQEEDKYTRRPVSTLAYASTLPMDLSFSERTDRSRLTSLSSSSSSTRSGTRCLTPNSRMRGREDSYDLYLEGVRGRRDRVHGYSLTRTSQTGVGGVELDPYSSPYDVGYGNESYGGHREEAYRKGGGSRRDHKCEACEYERARHVGREAFGNHHDIGVNEDSELGQRAKGPRPWDISRGRYDSCLSSSSQGSGSKREYGPTEVLRKTKRVEDGLASPIYVPEYKGCGRYDKLVERPLPVPMVPDTLRAGSPGMEDWKERRERREERDENRKGTIDEMDDLYESLRRAIAGNGNGGL